ncbi:olfactory receptor 2AP1-like [Pseudonaja textilis]|uniref:olfactory receptor 2AP1-like n=1 Tax=Pseudonaja textilis TaxID=8673 RepID=UPI000EA88B91|nr:olfactory receptor 2AP1-like [Pseudonaja textilis]
MQEKQQKNQTKIAEFVLLGFGEYSKTQTLLFLIFLITYAVSVTGNTLIVALVIFDRRFHTPMYFFLANLSFLEVFYSSNIFPRLLYALLTGNNMISVSSCFTQWYLFGSLEATECCLLCAMSYDRYLAICKPLHYATIMQAQTCVQLVAASWINGFITIVTLFHLMLQLTFCSSNEMDHYFCDYFSLLNLSCTDTNLIEIIGFIVAVLFTLPPFLLTLISYIYIIAAVWKIPSTTERQKAFSTCSSHLIVVSIFYGSLMIVYMLPKNNVNRNIEKNSSLLYTVVPPFTNPFIYSLRNKEVKEALKSNIKKLVQYKVPKTN